MEGFDAFTLSIMTLNRQVQKIKDKEMAAFGLKGSQVMLIYYLGRNPRGLTASELSRCCMEDKAAISRSLVRLESAGIVAPLPANPEKRDYRAKRLLTDEGKAVFRQMTTKINNAVRNGGNGLSDAQKGILHLALQTISDNLEALLTDEDPAESSQ